MIGGIALGVTPNATLSYGAARGMAGLCQVGVVPAALFGGVDTNAASINGNIPIVISAYADLSLVGTIQFTGSCPIQITPSALFGYDDLAPGLIGSIDVKVTPSVFANSTVYALVGQCSVTVVPFSYPGLARALVGHCDVAVLPSAQFDYGRNLAIVGQLPVNVLPSADLVFGRLLTLNGQFAVNISPAATMAATMQPAIHGHVDLVIQPSALFGAVRSNSITGIVLTRLIPSANLSLPPVITPGFVQRRFVGLLDGMTEALPLSAFSAELKASGVSTLACALSGDSALALEIAEHYGNDLRIMTRYQYADGHVEDYDFISAQIVDSTVTTQPLTGTEITINASVRLKVTASQPVKCSDIIHIELTDGGHKLYCAMNDTVRLGDQVLTDHGQFIAGQINYSVDAYSETMTITEYTADGVDLPGKIGANIRPRALTSYKVDKSNHYYGLWKATGFFYNGIANNSQTDGMPYLLWADSTGLLWYANGADGLANFPVLLDDDLTQASINT